MTEQDVLRGDLRRSLDLARPVAIRSLECEETSLGATDRGVERGHDARW